LEENEETKDLYNNDSEEEYKDELDGI